MRIALDGKVAVVTGSSSGIGSAVAIALAKAGANVVVNYRSSERDAKQVVSEIESIGAKTLLVQADVSKESDVIRLMSETKNKFGTLDILVANAGLQLDAAFTEMTIEQWQTVLDVNLTGQFLCAREALKLFLKKERRDDQSRGSIICMSSVHQHIPWSGHANYAASKGGVELMMQSLALEVAHHGIRVNSIAPGAIKTDINKSVWDDDEKLDELLQKIPQNRIGSVEDIANAAVWLASDASAYIQGATIVVDGGMSLYPSFKGVER